MYDAEATVAAKNSAVVTAKISGTIDSSSIETGKRVSAGEILATISAPELSARLKAAAAEAGKIEREFNRESGLLKKGASTESAVKDLRDALAAAKAKTAEAAAFENYAKISAPISGVIVAKYAQMGDLASPAAPLCEIADTSEIQARAEIPAKYAGAVEASADKIFKIRAGAKTYEASLAEVSPRVDEFTKTRLFKFGVKAPEGLVLGECVKMAFPTGTVEETVIPENCVSKMGQIDRAFAVENGVVKMRILRLGSRLENGLIVVKSGLAAGDEVVVSPNAQIREGVIVK